MSMDPTKWISFDKVSAEAQKRIETLYPYLKFDNCQFQEKHSGVFMRQGNSVKIEKLLDPPGYGPKRPTPTTTTTATRARRG